MNEFQAIMGLCNLRYIDHAIGERKVRSNLYKSKLKGIDGIRVLEEQEDVICNYGYFPVIVEEQFAVNRDEMYEILKQNNIFTRKYFSPITSDQECFINKYDRFSLKNARDLSQRVLVLPLYEGMDLDIIGRVVSIIQRM